MRFVSSNEGALHLYRRVDSGEWWLFLVPADAPTFMDVVTDVLDRVREEAWDSLLVDIHLGAVIFVKKSELKPEIINSIAVRHGAQIATADAEHDIIVPQTVKGEILNEAVSGGYKIGKRLAEYAKCLES